MRACPLNIAPQDLADVASVTVERAYRKMVLVVVSFNTVKTREKVADAASGQS